MELKTSGSRDSTHSGTRRRRPAGAFTLRALHYLLGLSLWMPGIALVNARSAGLQVALVLGVACVIGRLVTSGFRRDSLVLLACGWWATGLVMTALLSPISGSVNSATAFAANIVLLGGLALTAAPDDRVLQSLLGGFIAGGVLSSGYAVWQQLARYVEIPFAVPPLNNRSFSLVTNLTNQKGALARSYGLCSEPSVLASLLIPCLVVSLVQLAGSSSRRFARSVRTAVLAIGLICCGSLAIAISLPLAVVFSFALDGRLRRRGVGVVLALLVLGAVSLAGIAMWQPAQDRALALISRVRDITDDQSVIERLSSMVAGLRMFTDYPFFGCGILPPPELFRQYLPPWGLQFNLPTAPLSLIISILCGQGLMGATAAVVLYGLALTRSVGRSILGPLLVSLITVGVLQIGSISLYHFWIFPGMALALGGVKRRAAPRRRGLPRSPNSHADGPRRDGLS